MEQECGLWGKTCPECEGIVRDWDQLGGRVPVGIEVTRGGVRDAHTLEALYAGATAYVCGMCGVEVSAMHWENLPTRALSPTG